MGIGIVGIVAAWQLVGWLLSGRACHEGIYCDQLARLIQTEAGELRSESAPSWE